MRYFIDTNIFLRVAIKENERSFQECQRVLRLLKTGRVHALTSSLVFAEMQWVLSSFYKISKKNITDILRATLALKYLRIEDKLDPLWALGIYSQKKIKFLDCLLASHPEIRNGKIIIISYDRDFDHIKGVRRKDPREI